MFAPMPFHHGEPGHAAPRARRHAGDVGVGEALAFLAAPRQQPGHRAQNSDLAGAVGAEQQNDLPASTVRSTPCRMPIKRS